MCVYRNTKDARMGLTCVYFWRNQQTHLFATRNDDKMKTYGKRASLSNLHAKDRGAGYANPRPVQNHGFQVTSLGAIWIILHSLFLS